jgi:hypothetical protein
MDRLKVYVHSFEVPTVGFIDKQRAIDKEGHKGVDYCAQAQTTAFQGLAHHAGVFGKRYLSDEDRDVLMRIDGYCKDNALEYEVVDVGSLGFLAKLGLRMKGIKTPTICKGGKTLCGVPSDEDLRKLIWR